MALGDRQADCDEKRRSPTDRRIVHTSEGGNGSYRAIWRSVIDGQIAMRSVVLRLTGVSFIHRKEETALIAQYGVYQYSALPTVLGYGITSRIFDTPVRYIMILSKPRPKPACFVPPYLRRFIYHQ